MIAVLIAVSVAFLVSVLGTPFLIRILRPQHRPADPRRRADRAPARAQGRHADDGRHRDHRRRVPRLPIAHIRTEAIKFGDAAIALWFLILGLGFVGWLDDYLGVRRARNLGLRKRARPAGSSS